MLDLRDNETFLRYREILRLNPSSVVFAPLAELLILHKCYEEAITVCRKGLERNPDIVSGRVALARAYTGVSNYKRAMEEVRAVLKRYPAHPESVEILNFCEERLHEGRREREKKVPMQGPSKVFADELLPSSLDPAGDARWSTVTMAEIFASQGSTEKARGIYENVLKREPGNARAKEGLTKLVKTD